MQPDDTLPVEPDLPPASPDAPEIDTTGLDDAKSRRARLAAQIAAITALPEGDPTP